MYNVLNSEFLIFFAFGVEKFRAFGWRNAHDFGVEAQRHCPRGSRVRLSSDFLPKFWISRNRGGTRGRLRVGGVGALALEGIADFVVCGRQA